MMKKKSYFNSVAVTTLYVFSVIFDFRLVCQFSSQAPEPNRMERYPEKLKVSFI